MHKEANNRIWRTSVEPKFYSRSPVAGVANTEESLTAFDRGMHVSLLVFRKLC